MEQKQNKLYKAAKGYRDRGYSVIPIKPKSKEALVPWTDYQTRIPSEKEIQEIKQKTNEVIKKIKQEVKNEAEVKTDLTKNIIKQNTFKHNFRNGYADGTVEKEKKKILAERRKAKAGIK